ncbi:MAG: GHKL domain-containing protein [Sedimentisphaerales bacterium]|nr:GHKL domain-containing protein [Sedimentisphaerales bacterium]
MQWVILLLAGAVILPTICLLWFMTQAVRNERLAIKEKLLSVYSNSVNTSLKRTLDDDWLRLNLTFPFANAYLIFDENDNLIFPVENTSEDIISDDIFNKAYKLEYTDNNPDHAIAEYNLITETSQKDALRIKAEIASIRCLRKLNQLDNAIAKSRKVLSKYNDEDIHIRTQKVRVYLLLIEMLLQNNSIDIKNELSEMFDYASDNIATDDNLYLFGTNQQTTKPIPTSLQLIVLERFISFAEPIKKDTLISKKVKRAETLIPKLKLSLEMANLFKDLSFITIKGTNSHIFRLDTQEQLYAQYNHDNSNFAVRKYLKIYSQESIVHIFYPFVDDIEKLPSKCMIYDEKGDVVCGVKIASKPFIKSEININYFPGYTTELYVLSSDFEDAADKQVAVYIWAGVLVIVMILATGGFAGGTINKQMKMNKLKNDFIATITHELKTPLASIRVLADTLLEGNYNDQKQVKEYLGLICKENKRLTGLIDNFLTFSRMERNKQVFTFEKVSPADIAKSAIEAIQTKYNQKNCHFSQKIDDDILPISVDKDAIVTVLVNLLDNACKYTYDNKNIEFKVFSEGENVCFSVKDNGIGMTKRQIRKIFERFYQADTSLSRRAEGTGLGLSIVKFILDAHKATIEVKSQPEKGSTFIVRIPIL